MKKIIIALSLITAWSCWSCKKVIHINLNNAATKLVILGEVTNAPGPYQVTINNTVNFSESNNFPPVSGATVVITDDKGLIDSLEEVSAGHYQTHNSWQGLPGNTYNLKVISSGNTYTASSQMPPVVVLDSVKFQKDARGRNNNVIEAVTYFQDPPSVTNYYQFTETINGIPLAKTLIFDDRFSDGKYVILPLFTDSAYMKLGDALSLNMYCIDKNNYNYLSEIQQLVDGNPFNQATPANPDTNLSGGALGIFSAHTTQTKNVTVHL